MKVIFNRVVTGIFELSDCWLVTRWRLKVLAIILSWQCVMLFSMSDWLIFCLTVLWAILCYTVSISFYYWRKPECLERTTDFRSENRLFLSIEIVVERTLNVLVFKYLGYSWSTNFSLDKIWFEYVQ